MDINTDTQMSESFLTSIFLTLSGGFQDAYTYCCRGKVFANAQTGNIVLMSGHFFNGEFSEGLKYLIPLIAFALGVFVAENVGNKLKENKVMHWRQIIVLSEIYLLFAVGFMPQKIYYLANALVSFVCAMQVQSFRKVEGTAYASTMCIGNLRSGVACLSVFLRTKDHSYKMKTLRYFGVIFLFAIGAGIGKIATTYFSFKAIWGSCILLSISFAMMFIKTKQTNQK